MRSTSASAVSTLPASARAAAWLSSTAGELAVEGGEPRPVLLLVEVERGDLCLEDVDVAVAECERVLECCPSLRDLGVVPQRPVLFAEEDDRALGEAGLAAGVVEEHQREQAVRLGLVGHQLGEGAAEPDRVCRQFALAAVAFVEDQVDDGQHRGQPVGEQVGGRHPKRDPGGLDLALGAEEALCHRLLGDEEGAGDLPGGETAERS
jgi:hypothetical protein